MIQPYYEKNGIEIYHAKWEEVSAQLQNKSVDLFLTDPPYAEQTHEGARTARKRNVITSPVDNILIDFEPFTVETLRGCFDEIGRVAKKWVISFLDYKHTVAFEEHPPDNLRFVRFGVLIKPDSAPQYSGDRPGMGWESLAFLHTKGGRMVWNGGGRSSVFTYNVPRGVNRIGDHPTAKPPGLIGELINLFSAPGDLIVDPTIYYLTIYLFQNLLHLFPFSIESLL